MLALFLIGAALIAVGIVGLVVPALPGTPLVFLGILAIAAADGFTRLTPLTLVVVALLGVASMVLDFAAGLLGVRTAGGSRWGVLGAALGLIVGLPLGLLGLVLGPAVGAVALEYLKDSNFRRAMKSGAGVFVGFVIGTAVKFTLTFAMLGLAALAYLF